MESNINNISKTILGTVIITFIIVISIILISENKVYKIEKVTNIDTLPKVIIEDKVIKYNIKIDSLKNDFDKKVKVAIDADDSTSVELFIKLVTKE